MINRLIAHLLPLFPKKFIWLFSKKYIAGETIADAVRVVKDLNRQSVMSTIDILGESVNSREEVVLYQTKYLHAIKELGNSNLPVTFSVKPTMFGLLWDFDFCYESIRKIMVNASGKNIFIRIDMESSECTDLEFRLYEKLYKEFPAHVGIVLQAYLHRTLNDLEYLKRLSQDSHPINIRLCKGIYIESQKIAFKGRREIRDNFVKCTEVMLKYGFYPALATHDKKLIGSLTELITRFGLSQEQYEFQMLLGVTPLLRQTLVEQGHRMRVYVPYGEQWFDYSIRRLQENPRMVWDIIKSFFIRD